MIDKTDEAIRKALDFKSTSYVLSDGTLLKGIDPDMTRGAALISFTLADGRITKALRADLWRPDLWWDGVPIKDGWYEVKWEPQFGPPKPDDTVYVSGTEHGIPIWCWDASSESGPDGPFPGDDTPKALWRKVAPPQEEE